MGECEKELLKPKSFYKEKIISMVNEIHDTEFLYKIYIILKRHIEKGRY